MTTSRTTTANNPVAACKLSAETLDVKSLTIPTAMNQVAIVARKPMPAPHAARTSMRLFAPHHACGNRRQHQNTFQPFAKYEYANVEKRHRRTNVWSRGIRVALRGNPLPHQYPDHEQRRNSQKNAYPQAHTSRPGPQRHYRLRRNSCLLHNIFPVCTESRNAALQFFYSNKVAISWT